MNYFDSIENLSKEMAKLCECVSNLNIEKGNREAIEKDF